MTSSNPPSAKPPPEAAAPEAARPEAADRQVNVATGAKRAVRRWASAAEKLRSEQQQQLQAWRRGGEAGGSRMSRWVLGEGRPRMGHCPVFWGVTGFFLGGV